MGAGTWKQKVEPRGCNLWGATDGGGNVEKSGTQGGAGGTGDPFRVNGHQNVFGSSFGPGKRLSVKWVKAVCFCLSLCLSLCLFVPITSTLDAKDR